MQADKSTIVDEAVLYIKKLELTLSELERQKAQFLKGKSSANPTACDLPIITQQNLAIQSREAFLAEQGSTPVAVANPSSTLNPLFPAGPELPAATFRTWTSPNVILNVCGRDAHISISGPKKPGLFTPIFFVLEKYKLEVVSAQVSSARDRRMCMIQARANGGAEQFPETLCLVEEVFKQAAVEIMLWVNS
ncbi:UNVERIFIED_CONTAM: Transcription factor [Sesamum radiatum]|uniref:Transcription factor n=1 Tax=Sesamum radiatum TaxID=300843 RepID=A0AAW2UAA9_SESRA